MEPKDFNSYGSRRGNFLVMARGTFANIRLVNKLMDGEVSSWDVEWEYSGGKCVPRHVENSKRVPQGTVSVVIRLVRRLSTSQQGRRCMFMMLLRSIWITENRW